MLDLAKEAIYEENYEEAELLIKEIDELTPKTIQNDWDFSLIILIIVIGIIGFIYFKFTKKN